jgi:hypothetical protein
MQPDLPVPGERPGRSPFDDLRERLARLPASHPSAPGYRDVPDDRTEADAAQPDAAQPDAAQPDAAQPDAGEPDGTGADSAEDGADSAEDGADSAEDGADPGGPDAGRGIATVRPGRDGRPGGAAVGYLAADGGDGPYRPWFSAEPPRPWFSDDPAGRSG